MQYTKHTFFKEIFAFVALTHILLLILLIFFDKGDFEQEKFVINQNKAASTVVFMPLHKKIPVTKKSGSGQSNKNGKVLTYDQYQKALNRKKTALKTGTSSVKKSKKASTVGSKKKSAVTKSATKALPAQLQEKVKAPTMLHHEKPKAVVKKPAPIKQIPKKKPLKVVKTADKAKVEKKLTPKEKLISEKLLAQKLIAEKKEADKKLIDAKAVEKKEDKIPEKSEEVKPVPVVEPVKIEAEKKVDEPIVQEDVVSTTEQESLDQIESDDNNQSTDDEDDMDIDLDNITFVGRYDLEKHEIQAQIKTEISKYWKPPVGIAKTAVCELSILVGADGKALKVTIKKGSGSLAYDISGRAAVYQSRFPKEVCGKEFIIVLGS